jgi:hypothetical protein
MSPQLARVAQEHSPRRAFHSSATLHRVRSSETGSPDVLSASRYRNPLWHTPREAWTTWGSTASSRRPATGSACGPAHRPVSRTGYSRRCWPCLDANDELLGALAHVQYAEPVQSQKRLRQPTSVLHCQESPVLAAFRQPKMMEPLAPMVDGPLRQAPQFNAKSRIGAA